MFDIGDYIVYGQNGICQIVDITHPDMFDADADRLYYVLIPEKTKTSKLFCPTDNTRIVIRKVISGEEAKAIIEESSDIAPLEITNERARDDSYKTAMKSCDPRICMRIMKTLLLRKKQREESGKKITSTDERYLKMAEDGLFGELAIATGKKPEEIKELVLEKIGN